ncbi:fungal trichothecene efflux pump-domain-containing protein [Ilyonectria destructans]|nr:fungal trichothecene efflux pump-domain-containing protein [Ilyonectria destructans]
MLKKHSDNERLAEEVRAHIEFEEDPHRAALEDNSAETKVDVRTWLAIFSMALSFGPGVGLPFVSAAAIVVQITQELGGADKLAWVVGAWSLSTAVSFSLGGPLSDVFGRRELILGGQAIVTIGNIVGGTAQNVDGLIAAETLIGVGTGFIFVAYAGVPEMLPNKWRSLGLGILEGGISIPWGVVSVLLANALYEYASWRWIFYIGVIVEVISLLGTAFFYWPTPRPRGDFDKTRWQQFREIDWIGLFLFTAGLTTCLIGLTWGGTTAYPWKSAGAIVPIVGGFLALVAAFAYDFIWAKAPMFPPKLFTMVRGYLLILVVLFVSGMCFNALSALLPQGSLYMSTTDGIEIGILSLPLTLFSGITGVLVPLFAHRIKYIKWQLVVGMALQAIFIAASAATVNPNRKLAWDFLHVPHSQLGVAMGLLGTFRSAGGAVGNAIFNTIFQSKFRTYAGEEIANAAIGNGLNASDLGAIMPETIQYNLDIPGMLVDIDGITPAIREILRAAVRTAYGRAFQFVFYITIPFSVVALVCSLFIEDPTAYMTNHTQSKMQSRGVTQPQTNDLSEDEKATSSRDEGTEFIAWTGVYS